MTAPARCHNQRMGPLALALTLLLSVQAAEPVPDTRPAPTRPGLSWEQADSVVRTLRRVSRRVRSGRPASTDTIVVSQGEINSFVNLTLAEQIPPEVSDLELQLEQDQLGARAVVDLDLLRAKLPAEGPAAMLSMLTGTVPVEIEGRFESAEGLARVELQSVLIGGINLPPSLLAQIVSMATASAEQPEGLDIRAPLALPWTARSIRLEPGRALFDFFPPPR